MAQVFGILAPYYMSIGMPLGEFWHGEPEKVLTYIQAETFRVRRKQRELWHAGIYTARAVASVFSEKVSYFKEPLPDTAQDIEEYEERRRVEELERFKASFMAWAYNPNNKTGGQR